MSKLGQLFNGSMSTRLKLNRQQSTRLLPDKQSTRQLLLFEVNSSTAINSTTIWMPWLGGSRGLAPWLGHRERSSG